MRKKILPFVAIAIMVFFVACNNEDILTEPEQTFTFSASMPDDNPITRVALEEVDKYIELTWEEGDIMDVVITQGLNSAVGTATIDWTTISSDMKSAIFNPLITGIGAIDLDEPFNFYGVYGGGGLSDTNPTDALLPEDPSASGSLVQVQDNKDVMLYFAHEGVVQSDLNSGVTLHHLGSLFKITVQNNCETGTLNLEQGAMLVNANATDNQEWAFDFSPPVGTVFDLTTQEFKNTETLTNLMSFSTSIVEITPGQKAEYWSWYPVLPNSIFPELKLKLVGANPNDLTTVNSKPARTDPIEAGKNYRFYAEFDGDDLNFTIDVFEVPEP